MSKLEWKLLTKKRASSTQGVPPSKEHRPTVKGAQHDYDSGAR